MTSPPTPAVRSPLRQLRHILYRILEAPARKRRGMSLFINLALITVISLNAVAIMLHTVPDYNRQYARVFYDFELFSVVFFTIEYVVRVWICVENDRYAHPVWGRLRYVLSARAIIDLLAIFPFYFTLFATDLAVVRLLRIFRIFRLFRITRYSHAYRVIQHVIADKKEELVLCLVFNLFMLVIVSSVMYYIEHPAQPDKFTSIPATMWWGASAMATVGYGDIHPITPLGKLLGGLAAILGIMLFALPTSILVSGFTEHLRNQKTPRRCPHCGQLLKE